MQVGSANRLNTDFAYIERTYRKLNNTHNQ